MARHDDMGLIPEIILFRHVLIFWHNFNLEFSKELYLYNLLMNTNSKISSRHDDTCLNILLCSFLTED